MNRRILLIIIGIIVAVAGFWFLTKPAAENASTPSSHTYSQGSTGIVLVEYGDFQCPACGQYYPIIKQIKEQYKDLITFQFRHLPLVEIHVNARAGARAAEAAAMQGKFWEMHDLLFENQTAWQDTSDPVNTFAGYARQLGLDEARFLEDYKSSEINAIINADLAEFEKTGEAKSTPAFFLEGKKISPDGTIAGFQALLDEAIRAKGGTPPSADEPADAE